MSFRSRAEIFVITVCVSLLVARIYPPSAYLSNSSTTTPPPSKGLLNPLPDSSFSFSSLDPNPPLDPYPPSSTSGDERGWECNSLSKGCREFSEIESHPSSPSIDSSRVVSFSPSGIHDSGIKDHRLLLHVYYYSTFDINNNKCVISWRIIIDRIPSINVLSSKKLCREKNYYFVRLVIRKRLDLSDFYSMHLKQLSRTNSRIYIFRSSKYRKYKPSLYIYIYTKAITESMPWRGSINNFTILNNQLGAPARRFTIERILLPPPSLVIGIHAFAIAILLDTRISKILEAERL